MTKRLPSPEQQAEKFSSNATGQAADVPSNVFASASHADVAAVQAVMVLDDRYRIGDVLFGDAVQPARDTGHRRSHAVHRHV